MNPNEMHAWAGEGTPAGGDAAHGSRTADTTSSSASNGRIQAVVFDLGGVLIDWNPRHLYRRLFDDEAEMERFLAEVCTLEWNGTLDAGRPFAEAVDELARAFPDQAEMIRAWHLRWPEMLGGLVPGTLDLVHRIKDAGLPVYALSNWSAETFGTTRIRFPFLEELDGVLISGDVGVGKPNPRIFELLVERFGVQPSATVFIDDWDRNVLAAAKLGFRTIQFEDAAQAERELERMGVPVSAGEQPSGGAEPAG